MEVSKEDYELLKKIKKIREIRKKATSEAWHRQMKGKTKEEISAEMSRRKLSYKKTA